MTLAKATLSGIVLTEPEKRFTPNNTAVTNFNLQVQPTGRNESPFVVRITCWRALADTVVERLHKDMVVTVDGRLQVNTFEEQGGMTRRMYEVDASNVYIGQVEMLSTQTEGAPRNNTMGMTPPVAPQQQAAMAPQPAYAPQQPMAATAVASPVAPQESYDDIPF